MASIKPDDLQSISRLLQGGKFQDAATLATKLLKQNPGHASLLHLLGVALHKSGDLSGAEKSLKRALETSAENVDVLLALAAVHRQQGRTSQAERRLRRAIKLQPGNAAAWHSLGLLLFSTGAYDETQRCAREALKRNNRMPAVWELLAATLQKVGDIAAALAVCREGIALVPRAARLHYSLAQLLRQETDFTAAADAYENALACGFDTPDVYRNRAEALLDSGDVKGASAFADKGADRFPTHPLMQRTAARLAFSSGAERDPLEKLQRAVNQEPHNPALWQTLIELMKRLGRNDEVGPALAQAKRRGCPESKGLSVLEALEMADQDHAEAAVTRLELLCEQFSEDAYVRKSLAMLLLRAGEPERAAQHCRTWLEKHPHDQTVLAFWGTALHLLGDEREHWLLDYERMVTPVAVPPPAGYASSVEFFAELAVALEGLHHSNAQPIEQSVRGGTQTNGFLFRLKEPMLALLEQQLRLAISQAIEAFPDERDHPFWGRRSINSVVAAEALRFAGAWSVRLRDQGYHANHIHDQGWISSALYVALPQEVQEGTGTEGHIQFGTPMTELGLDLPPRRIVKPKVGELVLFPSYMWHGTLPFHSQESRTTVAFDLLPPR